MVDTSVEYGHDLEWTSIQKHDGKKLKIPYKHSGTNLWFRCVKSWSCHELVVVQGYNVQGAKIMFLYFIFNMDL